MEDQAFTDSTRERRQKYLALAMEAEEHAQNIAAAEDLRAAYLTLAAGWRRMAAELENPRTY